MLSQGSAWRRPGAAPATSSRHRLRPAPVPGVPTFTAIASMPSTTPIALRVYLQTPHARMPDLHLSRDETDNLIAYILSLRGH